MTISTSDPVWIAVQEWANAQIEKARDGLEETIHYPGADQVLRGRIAALRDLLALPAGDKTPAIPESPTY